MRPLPGFLEQACYQLVRLVMIPAAHAHFRRIDVLHLERLPRRGPVLLVANHPSSLTDVLVLAVALRRTLRFVAYSGLYQPWPHGWFLAACGVVPVWRHEDDPEHAWRNRASLARLTAALANGEAVAMFPEGDSRADRYVDRLKTGAARVALAYHLAGAPSGTLALIPAGLTFSQRTALRSDVTIAVGEALPLGRHLEHAHGDLEGAVHALTADLHAALSALILAVTERRDEPLVRDIERLAMARLRAAYPASAPHELLQEVTHAIAWYRAHDPVALERVAGLFEGYRARLRAHRLTDAVLAERVPAHAWLRRPLELLTLGAIGLPFMLVGAALHGVPLALAEAGARWVGRDPTRISYARIMGGVAGFGMLYCGAAWWMWSRHWPVPGIVGLLVAAAGLGVFAWSYRVWLARERHRLRLGWLLATRPGEVAALRGRRSLLVRLIERGGRRWLAEGGAPGLTRAS